MNKGLFWGFVGISITALYFGLGEYRLEVQEVKAYSFVSLMVWSMIFISLGVREGVPDYVRGMLGAAGGMSLFMAAEYLIAEIFVYTLGWGYFEVHLVVFIIGMLSASIVYVVFVGKELKKRRQD